MRVATILGVACGAILGAEAALLADDVDTNLPPTDAELNNDKETEDAKGDLAKMQEGAKPGAQYGEDADEAGTKAFVGCMETAPKCVEEVAQLEATMQAARLRAVGLNDANDAAEDAADAAKDAADAAEAALLEAQQEFSIIWVWETNKRRKEEEASRKAGEAQDAAADQKDAKQDAKAAEKSFIDAIQEKKGALKLSDACFAGILEKCTTKMERVADNTNKLNSFMKDQQCKKTQEEFQEMQSQHEELQAAMDDCEGDETEPNNSGAKSSSLDGPGDEAEPDEAEQAGIDHFTKCMGTTRCDENKAKLQAAAQAERLAAVKKNAAEKKENAAETAAKMALVEAQQEWSIWFLSKAKKERQASARELNAEVSRKLAERAEAAFTKAVAEKKEALHQTDECFADVVSTCSKKQQQVTENMRKFAIFMKTQECKKTLEAFEQFTGKFEKKEEEMDACMPDEEGPGGSGSEGESESPAELGSGADEYPGEQGSEAGTVSGSRSGDKAPASRTLKAPADKDAGAEGGGSIGLGDWLKTLMDKQAEKLQVSQEECSPMCKWSAANKANKGKCDFFPPPSYKGPSKSCDACSSCTGSPDKAAAASSKDTQAKQWGK